MAEDDGWRAYREGGTRTATFCRLEHVVPWTIRGAAWETPPPADEKLRVPIVGSCARCRTKLNEIDVVLVSHRAEHRIPDAFCSVDHMREWANAGGRWQ